MSLRVSTEHMRIVSYCVFSFLGMNNKIFFRFLKQKKIKRKNLGVHTDEMVWKYTWVRCTA